MTKKEGPLLISDVNNTEEQPIDDCKMSQEDLSQMRSVTDEQKPDHILGDSNIEYITNSKLGESQNEEESITEKKEVDDLIDDDRQSHSSSSEEVINPANDYEDLSFTY